MAAGSMKTKGIVTVVFLQIFEAYAYNLQHADSNFSIQTITITDYGDDKIHVQYPAPGADFEPDQSSLDSWSVVWYVASFGGLILFFLIVSCSEWCCRRHARRNCQRNNAQAAPQVVTDTPPPSYDQFAPPAYEDLWVGSSRGRSGEKSEYDIYVVPVHALGTIMEEARREEAPPSYQTASTGLSQSSEIARVHSSSVSSRVT